MYDDDDDYDDYGGEPRWLDGQQESLVRPEALLVWLVDSVRNTVQYPFRAYRDRARTAQDDPRPHRRCKLDVSCMTVCRILSQSRPT